MVNRSLLPPWPFVAVPTALLLLLPVPRTFIIRIYSTLKLAWKISAIDDDTMGLLIEGDGNTVLQALKLAGEHVCDVAEPLHPVVLAIDIGATRTKFLLIREGEDGVVLEAKSTWELWGIGNAITGEISFTFVLLSFNSMRCRKCVNPLIRITFFCEQERM